MLGFLDLLLHHRSLFFSSLAGGFNGSGVVFGHRRKNATRGNPNLRAYSVQMTLATRKAWRWREEGVVPNMREIQSAGDLVEKLVVVVFFSPGCGGCRALQLKICRVAEKNPDVLLLQVNYEEYKSMCCTLNVYVLPSFFLYAL